VAYLGTHDNSTFVGFLNTLPREKRERVATLLKGDPADDAGLCRLAIGALLECAAERVVLQVQDLLCEGDESRMNVPGISGHGNWMYRITEEKLTALERSADLWQTLLKKYNRLELPL
jgi:4-alpha-glucanotransferase